LTVSVGNIPVQIRILGRQAWADQAKTQALPIALWRGVVEATGDASGGLVILGMNTGFQATTAKAWSVEEIQLQSSPVAGTTNWLLLWTTGDPGFVAGTTDAAVMKAEARNNLIPGGSVYSTQVLMQPYARSLDTDPVTRRLFIPRPGQNDLMVCQALSANALGQLYKLEAWGYAWDRSRFDEGETLVRP
jgi:hypothetical protein